MIYKNKGSGIRINWTTGENTTELASLLREQLNYSKIELVEDLKEEEEGLVSYALGASQKLVPVCSFDLLHS